MAVAAIEDRLIGRCVHRVVVHPERDVRRWIDQRMSLVERLRRDTDDGEGTAGHADLVPDDRGVAAKPRKPVLVRQHDHRSITSRASFARLDETSERWLNTEEREVVVRDS